MQLHACAHVDPNWKGSANPWASLEFIPVTVVFEICPTTYPNIETMTPFRTLHLVWQPQAHGHSSPVGVQSLYSRHVGHRRPHVSEALLSQALHRHLLLESVQGHAAVHLGIAVPASHGAGACGLA